MADKLGLSVDFIPGDWRSGADAAIVESRLGADKAHAIKAVLVVHNETSTGVTTAIPPIRQAIDRAGHPALLMVDTISSLASIDYRHAEWGVGVRRWLAEGLMLPPGLSFNALATRRLPPTGGAPAAIVLGLGRHHRDEPAGLFSVHAGDQSAVRTARGDRHAARRRLAERVRAPITPTTRRAVRGWGLEILCRNPAEYSSSLTAIIVPDVTTPMPSAAKRARYDLSLGTGLGPRGKGFRIGHLGFFNDLTLRTLCGVEMALAASRVPHKSGGIAAALSFLAGAPSTKSGAAALAASTA
jgi:alanine-glyoxylate transaminase/serine-glyoxylate transaminase/serine-pyruvate transaminase